MRFSLDITYPFERIEGSRQRMLARERFEYVDRVPVLFCLAPRYFARVLGFAYGEFLTDVETQYYWQLQSAKYRLEKIPEDCCQEAVVRVSPYFDNVVNASAFGAEIGWSEDETPRALPTIKHVEDIEQLEIPEPDAGLWGKTLEWWHRMRELARQTEITFNGQQCRVEVAPLSIGGEGPHMIAIDLVGEDFYWWMLEYPEICHKLLDKITQGMIRAEKRFRQVDPRPRHGFGIAEDSAQIMSVELFREFCVPYDNALFDAFGRGLRDGRGMHMCGDSVHLHESLRDDLRMSSFNLFGYQVAPTIAAEKLGGDVYLWGNVNPMLMLDGTKDEVKEAGMKCISALAPCGGFTLGDGANVCPGTPVENLAALVEVAEEYGVPDGMQRRS